MGSISEPIYKQGDSPNYLLLLFDLVYSENLKRIKIYLPKLKSRKNELKRTFFYWSDTHVPIRGFTAGCSLLFRALDYKLQRTNKIKIKKIIKLLIQSGCEPRIEKPQLFQADHLFKIYELYANILEEMKKEKELL